METIADLVAAGRQRDGPLIDARERAAPYTFREFCTNAWKAGNLLGQYGAHPGSDGAVVVAPKPLPDRETSTTEGVVDSAAPLLGFLGTTLVGACADLTPETYVEARTLVRPVGTHWQERYLTTPRCSVLAYGGPPDDPPVVQFESALWSQNPTAPPESVDPETAAIRVDGHSHTHGVLMAATAEVVEAYDLDSTGRVGLIAPLREAGTLVAGVLAPLLSGATILLGDADAVVADATHLVGPSDVVPDLAVLDDRDTFIDASEVTDRLERTDSL